MSCESILFWQRPCTHVRDAYTEKAILMFPLTASLAASHKRVRLWNECPRLRLPNSPLGHTQRAKRLSLLGLLQLDAYEHNHILVSSSRSSRLPVRVTRKSFGAATNPLDRCPPFRNVGAPSCPLCTLLLLHHRSRASSPLAPHHHTRSHHSSKTLAAPIPCTLRSGPALHTTSLRANPSPHPRSRWASRLLL